LESFTDIFPSLGTFSLIFSEPWKIQAVLFQALAAKLPVSRTRLENRRAAGAL
jgi:hypothetical protein